jgi:hypothetical protein
VYGYSTIIAIGTGIFIQTSFSVAQAKAGREKAPAATAFIALAQALGIMLTLALSGAILPDVPKGTI